MSSHEGVSCDYCIKGNFTGKRYKCLICYDYDLCCACYEANVTSTRHSADHPMQCILTRLDFELYFGGETHGSEQQHQSYTCPLCGRMGFTDLLLQEHVGIEHADSSAEVVCPICACFPNGDPNHVVDDLAAHLLLEHRTSAELDSQLGSIRAIRRMPHHGRSVANTRTRRANLQFQSTTATLPVLSPGGRDREVMDPIAELLSQLSSARSRTAAAQSISSQLHQLEMQLQSTRYGNSRQQQQADRQLPSLGETVRSNATIPSCFGRFGTMAQVTGETLVPTAGFTSTTNTTVTNNSSSSPASSSSTIASSSVRGGAGHSDFLLSRLSEKNPSEVEQETMEMDRADKSLFVQELLLALFGENTETHEEEKADVQTCETSAEECKEIRPEALSTALPLQIGNNAESQQVINGTLTSSDQPTLLQRQPSSLETRLSVSNVVLPDGKVLVSRHPGKMKLRTGKEREAPVTKRHLP